MLCTGPTRMRKGKAKNQVEAESEGRIERRLRKVQVQGEPRSKKLQDWELLLSIRGSNQEKSKLLSMISAVRELQSTTANTEVEFTW